MKLIPALIPLCALLLPCALRAETFEGKLAMTMTTSKKETSQTINMSLKEGYMRTDITTDKGLSSVIMDFKGMQMYILMAQQQMYLVRSLTPPASAPAPTSTAHEQPTLEDTGVKENILGYTCTKFIAKTSKSSSEIWVTDQLGSWIGLNHGGAPGGRAQVPAAWEAAIKGRNFFPMRVVSTTEDGKVFRMEVTSVEKTSLPDSLFAPPEGWRKIDLGSMMGGMFPGGFPGSRPQNGNNN